MKSSISNTKKQIMLISVMLITLVLVLLIGQRTYALEVQAFTYNGNSLNYQAGDLITNLQADILEDITIMDEDFSNELITFSYSENTETEGKLNGGTHTVTLNAVAGEKVAVPLVLKIYVVTNFVDFSTDRTGQTNKAYSTGLIPPVENQPNTIETWIYFKSGYTGTDIGYVTGNGSGGSGQDTVALAVYGTGAFSLFWKGQLYPAITSGVASVPELTLEADTWSHIAAVRDKEAKVIRYYINAELVYTTPVNNNIGLDQTASTLTSNKEYGIGKDGRTATNRRLPAALSTVAVFSEVRTIEQIKEGMSNALSGNWNNVSNRWIWADFNNQNMDFITTVESFELEEGALKSDLVNLVNEKLEIKDMIGRTLTNQVTIPTELTNNDVLVAGNGKVTVSATDLFGNTENIEFDLIIKPLELPSMAYLGKVENHLAGKSKAELEEDILDKVTKLNSEEDIVFEYSEGAFTNGLLNRGNHTVTLTLEGTTPIVIDIYAINDYVNFLTDRTDDTNKAYSTGIIPPIEDQPNTIQTWLYVPSGIEDTLIGYVTGNGAGGTGAETVALVVYGHGAVGFFWRGTLYPSVGNTSTGATPSDPTVMIPKDTWTHVAAVRDKEAKVIRIYFNAELIYTSPVVANIGVDQDASKTGGNKEFGIGKDGRTAKDRRLPGMLSTVAVFSETRSQEQIKLDMASSLSGNWDNVSNRWLWVDLNNQNMSFTYPGPIEFISGLSVETVEQTLLQSASVKDLAGRNVSQLTAKVNQSLISEGVLTVGVSNVLFTATDLFGNTQNFEIEIEVVNGNALLIYTGSKTISHLSGYERLDIENYIKENLEIINYQGELEFIYSVGSLTDNKLNIGGFTVTVSIPDVDPIVLGLYGLDKSVSFLGDRDNSTNNAYSTGIIPTQQPNTIEAWIFIPAGLDPTLLGYVTGNGAGGSGSETVALAVYGSGAFSYFWKGSLYPSISSVASGAKPSIPELSIPTDKWTHIAVTRDVSAKVFRYYINGELIYTTPQLDVLTQNQDAQNTSGGKEYGIGKDGRTDSNRRLPGMLSTVTIYNVTRTQEEIIQGMTDAITGTGMTKANPELIYYANVYKVLNDTVAPTISFAVDPVFTVQLNDYNDAFLAFVNQNLSIVDDNTFSPASWTINYNGSTNLVQQFSKVGVFTIIITAKDISGNSDTFEIEVTVESDIDPSLIQEIEIIEGDVNLAVGQTKQLTTKVLPQTATETVIWSSSDASVATVSQAGLVTALKEGLTIITAKNTDGTINSSIALRVSNSDIKLVSLSINEENQNVEIYKTLQLNVTKNPTNTTENVVWETSNPLVAIVSSNGLVTAVAEGSVVITVKNSDGTVFDTVTLTVISPATPMPQPTGCAFDCSTADLATIALAIASLSGLLALLFLVFKKKY